MKKRHAFHLDFRRLIFNVQFPGDLSAFYSKTIHFTYFHILVDFAPKTTFWCPKIFFLKNILLKNIFCKMIVKKISAVIWAQKRPRIQIPDTKIVKTLRPYFGFFRSFIYGPDHMVSASGYCPEFGGYTPSKSPEFWVQAAR